MTGRKMGGHFLATGAAFCQTSKDFESDSHCNIVMSSYIATDLLTGALGNLQLVASHSFLTGTKKFHMESDPTLSQTCSYPRPYWVRPSVCCCP